ncbi:MAG: M56 family metallopeptidase [Oscillospiraceae bacterium]|nr:M56 family metallopeptidase [Oscillospiraceae bacterium]
MALPAVEPPEALRQESIYVLPVESRPAEESGVRFAEDGRIEARVRRPLEGTSAPVPVYTAMGLPSPCLVGLFCPAVYVTEEAAANPATLRHVLAHELTHYNHRDHLWSVLRGAALAVHWWNPLVWLAVVCSRRDGELACDEGALKRLGGGERTAYGETLLALVTAKSKPADLLSFATTMTGGKRSLKERIRRIAVQPRRLASAVVAVVVILSLAAVCAFGRAEAKEADPLFQPPGLCWNDSMATVIEKLGITEEQILYNEQDELSDPNTAKEQSLAVKDVSFLGYNTTVGFNFIHYAGAADGYGLNNVTVAFPEETDMAAVKAELIERYGEGEAGKSDPNYAYLALWPDLPDPQPDKENHHMYWTADRAALPEGYEDRVRDWLLNVRYKSAAPEKIEEYLAEAPMATLHWTDDWLLLTDILTANRVSFDAKQLVEFLQNVPLDETEPFSTYVRPYDVNRDGVQEGRSLSISVLTVRTTVLTHLRSPPLCVRSTNISRQGR